MQRFWVCCRTSVAHANAGAGASLPPAALCCSSHRFLHTQLFPALVAMSVCLNTMRNNKQFMVKCLHIGQTFALKM